MTGDGSGSLRIFRAYGIDVFVHWSWFIALVVLYDIADRDPVDFLVLYGMLFGVVILHEFGHALACRSTGGRVGHIVLWPLGGIAFVQPPPRATALLWTIAAGPLVNLVLIPVGLILGILAAGLGAEALVGYLNAFIVINLVLFLFNMMPAYPLDGGQILQAILWFFMSQAKALYYSSAVGLAFGGLMVAFGLLGYFNPELGRTLPITPIWMALLGAFITWQAHDAFRRAQAALQPWR